MFLYNCKVLETQDLPVKAVLIHSEDYTNFPELKLYYICKVLEITF